VTPSELCLKSLCVAAFSENNQSELEESLTAVTTTATAAMITFLFVHDRRGSGDRAEAQQRGKRRNLQVLFQSLKVLLET